MRPSRPNIGNRTQRPALWRDRGPDAAATSARNSAPRLACLLPPLRADRGNPDGGCSPIVWRQTILRVPHDGAERRRRRHPSQGDAQRLSAGGSLCSLQSFVFCGAASCPGPCLLSSRSLSQVAGIEERSMTRSNISARLFQNQSMIMRRSSTPRPLADAAEGREFVMHARIAVIQALKRNEPPPPFAELAKQSHWGKRKLKRDQ